MRRNPILCAVSPVSQNLCHQYLNDFYIFLALNYAAFGHSAYCRNHYRRLSHFGEKSCKLPSKILLSPRNCVGGDIVMRPFVCCWVSEWVRPSVCARVRHASTCGHKADYSLCQITFKLHMQVVHDERRKPIHFGSWVKGQGQIWHLVYKTLWT